MTNLSTLRGLVPQPARGCEWREQHTAYSILEPLIAEYGSPLNIHNTHQFDNNIHKLLDIAKTLGIPLDIFFARKANKCLSYVERARENEIGVDVASYQELVQCLDAGINGTQIVCSAAVKNNSLLTLCIDAGVTIAIDDEHELELVLDIARSKQISAKVCLRARGFSFDDKILFTRFGIDLHKLPSIITDYNSSDHLDIEGLHFHLTGYASETRRAALEQLLDLIERNPNVFSSLQYIDMGGGFPVNYLQSKELWRDFWQALDENTDLTFCSDLLGKHLRSIGNSTAGNVYPFAQDQADLSWFEKIFNTRGQEHSLIERLQRLNLRVRCEPGRWLLNDCGFTAARVASVKVNTKGDTCIFVEMNHTHCRTGSADFIIDPVIVHKRPINASDASTTGFIFGSYCTETDLIFKRRFKIPSQVGIGDILVIPNTAGYFMHFHESQSHQLPLAKNIFLPATTASDYRIDPIDASSTLDGK